MANFPIKKDEIVDGGIHSYVYPQHEKTDGSFVITGEKNPLPVANYMQNTSGIWIPQTGQNGKANVYDETVKQELEQIKQVQDDILTKLNGTISTDFSGNVNIENAVIDNTPENPLYTQVTGSIMEQTITDFTNLRAGASWVVVGEGDLYQFDGTKEWYLTMYTAGQVNEDNLSVLIEYFNQNSSSAARRVYRDELTMENGKLGASLVRFADRPAWYVSLDAIERIPLGDYFRLTLINNGTVDIPTMTVTLKEIKH